MKRKKMLYRAMFMMALGIFIVASAVEVMASGGINPPGVEPGYKVTGPGLRGMLVVGWRPGQGGVGVVEAFLFVDDKIYVDILASECPEEVFLATQAADILKWEFPSEIALDYNMPPLTRVKVLYEKDISNFYLHTVQLMSFMHILRCDVKVSFMVPSTK